MTLGFDQHAIGVVQLLVEVTGKLHVDVADGPEAAFLRDSQGKDPSSCGLLGRGMVALARGRLEEARELSRQLEALGVPPLPLPSAQVLPAQLRELAGFGSITRAEAALLLVGFGPPAAGSSELMVLVTPMKS